MTPVKHRYTCNFVRVLAEVRSPAVTRSETEIENDGAIRWRDTVRETELHFARNCGGNPALLELSRLHQRGISVRFSVNYLRRSVRPGRKHPVRLSKTLLPSLGEKKDTLCGKLPSSKILSASVSRCEISLNRRFQVIIICDVNIITRYGSTVK